MARIPLDTNIVGALIGRPPQAALHSWYRALEPKQVFLSSVTLAETLYGIRRPPEGRRRARMLDWFEHDLMPAFQGRILEFDARAARRWAGLMAAAERAGHRADPLDCQIAAIAVAHDLAVATRNLRDFAFLGVRSLDPLALGAR